MSLVLNDPAFNAVCDEVANVLQVSFGSAVILPNQSVLFLENNNLYSVSAGSDSLGHMDPAGSLCPVAWRDERGSWEGEDSGAIMLPCSGAIAFSDISGVPAERWVNFNANGHRWSFNSDELAQWDEEDQHFAFQAYHGLSSPTETAVRQFVDQLCVAG